ELGPDEPRAVRGDPHEARRELPRADSVGAPDAEVVAIGPPGASVRVEPDVVGALERVLLHADLPADAARVELEELPAGLGPGAREEEARASREGDAELPGDAHRTGARCDGDLVAAEGRPDALRDPDVGGHLGCLARDELEGDRAVPGRPRDAAPVDRR